MTLNYSRLKGKIIEKFNSQKKFAEAMNWSERTCSLKMNGAIDWTQSDIIKAQHLLSLKDSEIQAYFFEIKVQ
ncbi:DUF739 family protein [Peptostreptococcus porci]|uniref:DUF739 family protein n=1 Tax=Peptostreptococcus porci TaxID=2652282 RepID=UPI002A90B97A|nr:DUF739 family protein [Peptostreptococcus porci]MDY5437168.1 DUF739 family protein [Peptostreptococcus porci]MDY6232789.1 DUF739 family protein [Peptostreptococcus porci]